jgi:2-oxoglutarate/2-oxoacid ferredoxin oxidoreductase subunit alpha
MPRELLKGNVAFAEAAIRAGCQAYFGYPITPQTEALEHMSARMPELGRVFVQAESEIAAINMVYGAATAGVRTMTSSSGPGVSLMMEALSYIAASEVPAVLVDVMRGGPGLGNIAPAQSDYAQMTRGGGHGDSRMIVLAPATVQELIDLTVLAFDLADRYRCVAVVLLDGSLGQMMEPARLPPMGSLRSRSERPTWALTGAVGREPQAISSIHLDPLEQEAFNGTLQAKYAEIERAEVRFEEHALRDARLAVVAFGTAARIAKTAIATARAEGVAVGLLRPISLYPFPADRLARLSREVEAILVVEMNAGQMVDDVRLATRERVPVSFFGRPGGILPLPEEVLDAIHAAARRLPAQEVAS